MSLNIISKFFHVIEYNIKMEKKKHHPTLDHLHSPHESDPERPRVGPTGHKLLDDLAFPSNTKQVSQFTFFKGLSVRGESGITMN